jgi:cell division protein FtsW
MAFTFPRRPNSRPNIGAGSPSRYNSATPHVGPRVSPSRPATPTVTAAARPNASRMTTATAASSSVRGSSRRPDSEVMHRRGRDRLETYVDVRGIRGWTPLSLGLVGLVALLTTVGLVFVASSSSVYALHRWGNPWHLFEKQVLFVGMGLVCFITTMLLPYRTWRVAGPLLLGGSFLGVLATFTSLGISKNGSTRWIGPEALAFQPSEVMKLGLAATLAVGLAEIEGHSDEQRKIRNQILVVLVLVIAPIFLQPDMGTAMILVAILASMIVATGLPGRVLLRYGVIGLAATTLLAIVEPYRRDRLLAFMHPDKDPDGIGYHVMQSKMGFASGHFTGVGVGASRAKWGFLPNSYTDFIFAIIGEEIGMVGALLVMSSFLLIALCGSHIARRTDDRFASLLAVGITTWIVSQAVINMGAVIGTMPVTGVPLPFISKGGSSFVILMAAAGVLINIARHTRRVVRFGEAPRKAPSLQSATAR